MAKHAFRSTEELEIINFGYPSDKRPLHSLLNFCDGPPSALLMYLAPHTLLLTYIHTTHALPRRGSRGISDIFHNLTKLLSCEAVWSQSRLTSMEERQRCYSFNFLICPGRHTRLLLTAYKYYLIVVLLVFIVMIHNKRFILVCVKRNWAVNQFVSHYAILLTRNIETAFCISKSLQASINKASR
jgi:hypothetical protein